MNDIGSDGSGDNFQEREELLYDLQTDGKLE